MCIEKWSWLDEAVLRFSRSLQVCITCHFFRHHPGPNCIPQLACHLHRGWTESLHRQRLEVTSGELLPDQPLLTREESLQLWSEKRQQGWQACPPQWALSSERHPRDGVQPSSMGRSVSRPCC